MITFPLDIHIGSAIIKIHLLMEVLAFFIGLSYYTHPRSKTKDPISEENRWWILVGATAGALLGSHLLGGLEALDKVPLYLGILLSKTIVGGLLGGLIGVEITKKIIKEKHSSGDLIVFPIIIGIAIGRIGCLLTGVTDATVGNPSSLPWAFDQGDGIPRHPTSLYEIIFLLSLFIIIYIAQKRITFKSGNLFALFMTSYLGFRFLIEFIKPINQVFLGLSFIQLACLAGLMYYLCIFKKKGALDGKTLHVL